MLFYNNESESALSITYESSRCTVNKKAGNPNFLLNKGLNRVIPADSFLKWIENWQLNAFLGVDSFFKTALAKYRVRNHKLGKVILLLDGLIDRISMFLSIRPSNSRITLPSL